MTDRLDQGFPVFREYCWHGPDLDATIAQHIPTHQSRAAVNSWANLWEADPGLAAEAKGLYLSAGAYDGSDIAARFHASERPTLFLELAGVELTRDGILRFVTRNGLLEVSDRNRVNAPSRREWGQSDSFFDIVEQVMEMRRALGLLVERDRLRNARRFDMASKYTEQLAAQIRPHYREGERSIDDNLKRVSRQSRLIDAIWVGLLDAIDRKARIYCCDRCGKFFQVADKAASTEQHYCGNTCRVGAYRGRKQTAATMHARGATFREIARETGSDVQTIKGWLEKVS
ncbi:MAG TPA: hypothetical protein VMV10_03715 [Pirellulales bacterium]|nr:hypothetical protein [Pirellulales bacterium]